MRPSGQRALMIVIASAAVLAAAAGWLWNDDMAGGDGRSADGAEGVSAGSGVGGANGASGGDGVSGSNGPGGTAQSGATRSGRENNEGEVQNPMVTIEMDSGAKIVMELYPDVAPNTVNNFVSLVRQGFYDGVIFHRIVPGFVIQGGDPQGLGIGGPGYSIKGEFAANGFPNDLSHTRGVVSMARAQHPDSAGSQFFIVVQDATFLDGQYAAFGKVVDGMEEVDRIVSLPRDPQDRPLNPPVMVKVTVDEGGAAYPEPEKIVPPAR